MKLYIFSSVNGKISREEKEVIEKNKIFVEKVGISERHYAKNMLEVDYEYNGIRIKGLAGKGTLCRPNRAYETFLVNKRYIKSGIMIRALEEAYKTQIMVSKFPAAILKFLRKLLI